jgi:hypothetical protein
LVDLGGFTMETAGALSYGRRVWALAKVSEGADIVGPWPLALAVLIVALGPRRLRRGPWFLFFGPWPMARGPLGPRGFSLCCLFCFLIFSLVRWWRGWVGPLIFFVFVFVVA